VLAAIIDAVLLRVVVAPIHLFLAVSDWPDDERRSHARMGLGLLGGGVTLIALFFGGWLYEALMESSSYQATLGKMVCGMKSPISTATESHSGAQPAGILRKFFPPCFWASATSWSHSRSANRACTICWQVR